MCTVGCEVYRCRQYKPRTLCFLGTVNHTAFPPEATIFLPNGLIEKINFYTRNNLRTFYSQHSKNFFIHRLSFFKVLDFYYHFLPFYFFLNFANVKEPIDPDFCLTTIQNGIPILHLRLLPSCGEQKGEWGGGGRGVEEGGENGGFLLAPLGGRGSPPPLHVKPSKCVGNS
jgi:hypothetical protein